MTTRSKRLLVILACAAVLLVAAVAVFIIRNPKGGPLTLISDLTTTVTTEQAEPGGKATSFVTSEAVHVRADYIVPKNAFDDSRSCAVVAEGHARRLLMDEIASLLDQNTGVRKTGITKDMIPALAVASLQENIKTDNDRCYAEISSSFEPIEAINDMLKVLDGPFRGRDSIEIRAMAISALDNISNMTVNGGGDKNSVPDPKARYTGFVNQLRFVRAFEAGRAYQKYTDASDNAVRAYSEAITANPNSAYAFYYRSISHGRWKEAFDDLSEAIRIAPDKSFLYFRRGNMMKNSSKETAIDDFSNAIRLSPDNEAAYMARGEIYREIGKTDLAMQDFDKAISVRPGKAVYYNQRGVFFFRDNNFSKALNDFDKAVELSQDEAIYYYNRATAYAKLGKRGEAIADFQKAIDIKGEMKDAERHILELTRER